VTRFEGLGLRGGRALAALSPFVAYAYWGPALHEARVSAALKTGGTVTVHAVDQDSGRAIEQGRRALERALARSAGTAKTGSSDSGQDHFQSLLRVADAIIAQPSATPETAPGPRRSAVERAKLEAERSQLQAQLRGALASRRTDSDNPFDDTAAPLPSPSNHAVLRRRIAEIDGLLAAVGSTGGVTSAPVVPAELAALARAVPGAAPKATPAASDAGDTLVVAAKIVPDPLQVLMLGLFAGLGAALLPTRRRRADQQLPSELRAGPLTRSTPPSRPQLEPRRWPSDAPPPPSGQPRSRSSPSSAPPAAPSEPPVATGRDESPVMAYPIAWRPPSSGELAQYRNLRDQVKDRATTGCVVVAVSATATASERKPALAAALAAALAEDPESRVLLVEADLQHPGVCGALGIAMIPAADLVMQLEARVAGSAERHWYVLKCSPSLHVLPSRAEGRTLILSTHFEACLTSLRPFYDVIVLNAPSLSDTIACRAVNDVVDGVVVARRPEDPVSGAVTPFSSQEWFVHVPVATVGTDRATTA
jgi:Mrp family chromosome partitioning ATPase